MMRRILAISAEGLKGSFPGHNSGQTVIAEELDGHTRHRSRRTMNCRSGTGSYRNRLHDLVFFTRPSIGLVVAGDAPT